MINTAAKERFDEALLLHVHSQAVCNTKNNGKTRSGIFVDKYKGNSKVSHNPVGFIDKRMNEVWNAFGSGFSTEQLSNASVSNGGHSNLRAIVDSLQSDSLNRVWSSYKTAAAKAWK